MLHFFNSNNLDLLHSMLADCCLPQHLGGGTMVAMGGWWPPWLVGASLMFPLNCSMVTFYSHLRSFWHTQKEKISTHLKKVITAKVEKHLIWNM
jgi:hypothetical protein